MKQNLAFAFVCNAHGIALAMSLSALSVIGNAPRLRAKSARPR